MTESTSTAPVELTGQPTLARSPSPSSAMHAPQYPASDITTSGSLPLTPPTSPGPHTGTKTSFDTTLSHSSRQEYLDSLQPPTSEEFARLARLQEQREKEHKHRDHKLRRQSLATAQRGMEARRNSIQIQAPEGEQRGERRRSIFGRSHSRSISRPGTAGKDPENDPARSTAAMVIQRYYRGYRVRREMQGLGLDSSTRWTHAIRDAQWKELTRPRAREDGPVDPGNDGVNTRRSSTSRSAARQNWMKVATIARRAGVDEDSDHSEDSSISPTDEELRRMSPDRREAAKRKRRKAQAKRRKHAQMMGLQYFLEMV
ncbi:hypothetical protein F5B20DRAFT_273933 [Whalleya microplaca]|nr:hypothetical protein F5B20DRAFT_273933 [Whalleya microplaca]